MTKNLKSIYYFKHVATLIVKVKFCLNVVSKKQFKLKFLVLSQPCTNKINRSSYLYYRISKDYTSDVDPHFIRIIQVLKSNIRV